MMNGILVVDKPQGFTSFDVVAKLRGICGTKKIGHGGTLDPMATGVLPVFVGPAVKAVDLAPRQDKAYEAEILFGVATDTGDVTGEVLRRAEAVVTAEQIVAVLPRFLGRQQQLPPMYSAVKVGGKPLYRYAREGKAVERKAREIEIFSIELAEPELTGEGAADLARSLPQEPPPQAGAALSAGGSRFTLRVHCGKGTYIRTLVEDIGEALGLPATLAALRRTAAGVFGLERAHTLDTIQRAKDEGRLDSLFLPLETIFAGWPRCRLDAAAMARLKSGAPVYALPGGGFAGFGPAVGAADAPGPDADCAGLEPVVGALGEPDAPGTAAGGPAGASAGAGTGGEAVPQGGPARNRLGLAAGRYAAFYEDGFVGLAQVGPDEILRAEKLFIERG